MAVSGDFLNLAFTNAGGAHADAASGAVDEGADVLEVDVPAALGYIVRVTDAVAELRTAAADFTNSSHKTEISSRYEFKL